MIVLRIILLLATLLVAAALSEERLVDRSKLTLHILICGCGSIVFFYYEDNRQQLPTFGRSMRQEFLMNSQFILLDHGAYGRLFETFIYCVVSTYMHVS